MKPGDSGHGSASGQLCGSGHESGSGHAAEAGPYGPPDGLRAPSAGAEGRIGARLGGALLSDI
jgi:hypothetical protein